MTRINSNINPKSLCDKHLLVEYYEITRLQKIDFSKSHIIPKHFVLNAGHLKFFYNKQAFLHNRYYKLWFELNKRGFDVGTKQEFLDNKYNKEWNRISHEYPHFYNNYNFHKEEIRLSIYRILKSLFNMKINGSKIKFYKEEKDYEFAISKLIKECKEYNLESADFVYYHKKIDDYRKVDLEHNFGLIKNHELNLIKELSHLFNNFYK